MLACALMSNLYIIYEQLVKKSRLQVYQSNSKVFIQYISSLIHYLFVVSSISICAYFRWLLWKLQKLVLRVMPFVLGLQIHQVSFIVSKNYFSSVCNIAFYVNQPRSRLITKVLIAFQLIYKFITLRTILIVPIHLLIPCKEYRITQNFPFLKY